MALAHPFEISGKVQVTQNCLTAGLGMNGLVALPGLRRGWPWCVPKLLFISVYHQFLSCSQNPFKPYFFIIISVIPQTISTILTICPIFQTAINIPQTTILFPSNIIGSYHMTMKHQYIMNWMGCILKPLYQWIHQIRLYHTYNLAPLTRNESTVYRHKMVTVCSSRKAKNDI